MLNIDSVSSGTAGEDKDYVGGGSYIWETGVYDVTISMCYGLEKPSGSMCLHFDFKNDEGKVFSTEEYFLSSKRKIEYAAMKDGKPLLDKNDKPIMRHIPGFVRCSNVIGMAFSDKYASFVRDESNGPTMTKRQEKFFEAAINSMEEKTINVWDWDKKQSLPTKVKYVMPKIIGQRIKIAVSKNLVNKREKNSDGVYVEVVETREENELSLEFNEAGFSAMEVRAGNTELETMPSWIEKNEGQTRDKRSAAFKKDSRTDKQKIEDTTPPDSAADQKTLFDNL